MLWINRSYYCMHQCCNLSLLQMKCIERNIGIRRTEKKNLRPSYEEFFSPKFYFQAKQDWRLEGSAEWHFFFPTSSSEVKNEEPSSTFFDKYNTYGGTCEELCFVFLRFLYLISVYFCIFVKLDDIVADSENCKKLLTSHIDEFAFLMSHILME